MTNDEKKTNGDDATVRHSSFVLRRLLPFFPSRGKLLLLVGSIAVALIIGEIAVRLIGQAPEIIPIGVSSDEHVYRRSTNPILSYEFKPGFRSDAENLSFDYREINSHGLRDVEREYPKPPGTRRIILLGDSVVVGYRIKEIDQLMSRQLEMLYSDENVEVLNVAVTGYCTRAEVELLRVQAVKYDPDAVILVFVENDFRNFNPESIGADGVANRPAAIGWMFRKSHLFRLACVQFNWFSFGLEADPASWNQKAIGDNNVAEGLALLRELADEHGFKPLVAVWPGFGHDGIEYPDKMFMPDGKELIVERLARGYDLPVAGLRDAFHDHWQQQTPRPVPRQYYSVGDEMHASVVGHRVTAEILRDVVDERHLLEPGRSQTARAVHAPDDDDALRAAMELGTEKAGYGLLYINRAVTLYDEGKLDEAVEQLEKVDASDARNYADASVTLALILAQQGKVDKAKSRLQKVLKATPDHFQAQMVLASLWNMQQAYEKEIEQLQRAVDLRPDSYDARFHLGLTLARLRRWKQAEPHLSAAVRSNPASAAAARQLALALANQGELSRAAVQFERVVQLDPQSGRGYVELGAALDKIRRSEEALLVFRKGLVVDADNAELHRRLGLILARHSQLNEASVHLRRAVELAPGSVEASNGLAFLFVCQGREKEAVEQLRRSLELDPDNKTARANLDRLQNRQP
ncbi:MAG: tetratricopeptide repeat protein [Candidatus Nealsonbacteria bacterium]|nr:tetratricopeptide repeat protein [Candidatus Nealsonbacteria bacterium]